MSSFEHLSAPAPAGEAFLGLGDAARLLGITPQTLRRWADRGQISSYTTPGGHRRFPRSAVAALVPAGRARRPMLAKLGVTERVARAYRRQAPAVRGAGAGWLSAVDAAAIDVFRERGRRMCECLLAHLDAEGPEVAMATLHEAAGHAAEYGGTSARMGAGLSQAVQAFLRYRAPFVDELAAVARRRGLDTREATTLLVDAENAMDELLLAFVGGWQQAQP